MAHHVHDAQLHHCLGEHRLNGLRKALEPINAGNEDVLHTAVAQFGDDLQPELGPLGLGQPQAQHLLLARHGDANGQVHRLDPHRTLAHFYMDAVEVNDGVDRLQGSGLPGFDFIGHRIGYRGNQAGRDLGAIHLLQVGLNLAHRHASGVQRDDFVVEAGPAGLVLGDELGFEAAVAVAGHFDGQLTEIALERLLAPAIAGVATGVGYCLVALVTQVLGQFGLQGSLEQQFG